MEACFAQAARILTTSRIVDHEESDARTRHRAPVGARGDHGNKLQTERKPVGIRGRLQEWPHLLWLPSAGRKEIRPFGRAELDFDFAATQLRSHLALEHPQQAGRN